MLIVYDPFKSGLLAYYLICMMLWSRGKCLGVYWFITFRLNLRLMQVREVWLIFFFFKYLNGNSSEQYEISG